MTMTSAEHHERILNDPEYRERWFGELARTVAVDFDGVLHPYTRGWTGPNPTDEAPSEGASEFLKELDRDGFRIVVFSSRCDTDEGLRGVRRWLSQHGLMSLIADVTCTKPPAVAYVDDRAVTYRAGNWSECREQIDRLTNTKSDGVGHG